MRMSEAFVPTLREVPAEAEIVSHQLALRAGLLRRSSAGVYTHLPLGYRTLKKIMQIIREELDAIGAQELMLPIVQPAELWRASGRWDAYGAEMFRLKDRHDREYCLGPTHEEIITALVGAEVDSYRQLPLSLYQIQNKYRDEIRPRFGVIRGREFIMKDAYSFDRDPEGLNETYERFFRAYQRIFARCGLTVHAVEADSGAIGGSHTHEFMVLAEVGEDRIVHCPQCGYAANVEKAVAVPTPWPVTASGGQAEAVATPGVRTIDELEAFLGVPANRMIKTLFYLADGEPVAALVRGDRELNEVKLATALGATRLEMAPPERIEELTGAPVGFSGPVGLSGVRIVADHEVVGALDAVAGANAADAHLIHLDWGRDFAADVACDLRTAVPGDTCPSCREAALEGASGIEVGQVFQLGTKYSEALGARFKDAEGKEQPIWMGCYGIGVTRTMAAIIEQHHDDDGIIWPVTVAPYQAIVVPIKATDADQMEAAKKVYEQLWTAGIDAVLDDRDERPGVKFKDADLIGFPVRITVGPKALAEGRVEVRWRDNRREERPLLSEVVGVVQAGLRERARF
ncbi:MAG: proline--tRNA ligase [Firmicutes bacterium]|nr:proline--tRNA ligase [Bacillota bacterium]